MKKAIHLQIITAATLAAGILLTSVLLAGRVASSSLFLQSKLVGSVFSQESVGFADMLNRRENVRMLFKFAGAVTAAYINFELIPVHEADTFAAVFEGINDDVTVDKFEYQRKNLIIDGTALTREGYGQFVEALRDEGYFTSVSADEYITTEDTIRFRMICVSGRYTE